MPKVEAIFPTELDKGKIRYAPGIRAGKWVFATGHLATDYKSGVRAEVLQERLPFYGKTKYEREAEAIYKDLNDILVAAGTNISNVVRVDQYYTSWKAVDPYHIVRKSRFGNAMPCSTSVLQNKLLLKDAEIEVQMIGVLPEKGLAPERIFPAVVKVPPTSGYTPVIKFGDFVFIAGNMATDDKGIAPETKPVYGQIWGGTQVKRETDYIIKERIKPALEASGSSLENVIKAQVYLNDIFDYPAFSSTWNKYFPKDPPVFSLIPTSGFGHPTGKVEINIIALANDGKTKREIIEEKIFTGYESQSVGIRAGDLLFLSGMMAIDKDGLVGDAEIDPRQPYFGSSIQAQMRTILHNIERVCSAAGTSLENAVRIQQFHTDLTEFYHSYKVWQEFVPGQFLPLSAVQVQGPLPVPGCTVLLDAWFYVP
jgi:enamine deaminase RidA (YjgF/YER057c/UK114 family)